MIFQNADLITTLCLSVIPIFTDGEDGYPSDADRGTGFIVQVRDRYFLVSAAHVLKKALEGRKLFLPTTRRILDPSRLVFAPENIDIAVYDLGMHWPFPRSLDKWPLRPEHLSPLALPQDERLWGPTDQKWVYIISGFPASGDQINRDKKEMTSTCYAIGGVDLGAQVYSKLPHLNPDIHLGFMHIDRTEFNQIPHPEGMSGSPVWLALEDGEDPVNPKPFSVIGVFIEYWPDHQAAVAVHINEVVKLMSQFSN